MTTTCKVTLTNDQLWDLDVAGRNVDDWLKNNMRDRYTETFAGRTKYMSNSPYRTWEFKNEDDALYFKLKFL